MNDFVFKVLWGLASLVAYIAIFFFRKNTGDKYRVLKRIVVLVLLAAGIYLLLR